MTDRGKHSERQLATAAALVVTALLITFPLRTLTAEYCYARFEQVLDDPDTEELDVIAISAESMPAYREALRLLDDAILLRPTNADYRRALVDIYVKIGTWTAVMESMDSRLPHGWMNSADAYDRAERHLREAVSLDPTCSEYHITRAQLYEKRGEKGLFEKEVALAVDSAPRNVAIRYAAARMYLLSGNKMRAFEEAKQLAGIDDSYLSDDTSENIMAREHRLPEYVSRLSETYLFQALEIAWRATGKDVFAVNSVVPDNRDAHEVLQLFWEMKGIQE